MEAIVLRLLTAILLTAFVRGLAEDTALNSLVVETTDKIVEQLGWKRDDITIHNINTRNARIGQSLIYELDVDIGGNILPIKLSEDIVKWRLLHPVDEKETVEVPNAELAPFQIAGPVELWLDDAKDLRLAAPHDVDAGVLKRVVLANGASVTVTGARQVNLARPLQIPRSLITGTSTPLLSLSTRLKHASKTKPLLSLRLLGPSSLLASSSSSAAAAASSSATIDLAKRLVKVKRVAAGAVELISNSDALTEEEELEEEKKWLWPLKSLNSSDDKLKAVEKSLMSYLEQQTQQHSSFNLLRAKASAVTLFKLEFTLVKKMRLSEEENMTWPEWATKPSVETMVMELIGESSGGGDKKMTAQSVRQVEHLSPARSFPALDLRSELNVTFTKLPNVYTPVSPFTL